MSTSSQGLVEIDENDSIGSPTLLGPHTPSKVPYSSLSSSWDQTNNSTYLPSPPNSESSEHNVRTPSVNRSAETFIQCLFDLNPQSETIFNLLHREAFEGEICVLRDEDALYTLVPTFGGLDHDHLASQEDQESNTCFCRLDYISTDSTVNSVKIDGETCHYARLGWLVRQDERTKSRITTNYILLLNVTTKPPSLWLVYDYLRPDREEEDEGEDVRSLGEHYNDYEHDAWYYGRGTLLDNDSSGDGVSSSEFWSSATGGQSFLEAQKPFDLAMMSREVKKDWEGHAWSGLDSAKVRACMAGSSNVLGNTLRAVPSRPKDYSEC